MECGAKRPFYSETEKPVSSDPKLLTLRDRKIALTDDTTESKRRRISSNLDCILVPVTGSSDSVAPSPCMSASSSTIMLSSRSLTSCTSMRPSSGRRVESRWSKVR